MPPQITRLVYLTLAIVASYFVARGFLVPQSFGQYGWYRGNALKEIAALPVSYAGRAACAGCHDDPAGQLAKGSHKGLSCESCHGPGSAHAEDPTVAAPKPTGPRFCLRCHELNLSRPAKFPQVETADHFPDQACAECHAPHSPKDAPKASPKDASPPAAKAAPRK
jgi:hypothetical protein